MSSDLRPRRKNISPSLRVEEIPFQIYKDSPTIKTYTDWSYLEGRLLSKATTNDIEEEDSARLLREYYDVVIKLSEGKAIIEKGSPHVVLRTSCGEEALRYFSVDENRLIARHFVNIEGCVEVKFEGVSGTRVGVIVNSPAKGSRSYHLLVSASGGSAGAFDLYYLGLKSQGTVSITADYRLEAGSRIDSLATVLQSGESAFIGWRRAVLEERSRLSYGAVIIGGHARLHDESFQVGTGSSLTLKSLLLSGRGNFIDYITNSVNLSESTSSHMTVRGAATSGKVFYRGNVKAGAKAHGSVNKLQSQMYLLSKDAVVVSVPSLEVETDFVEEASHSTDISTLEDTDLFYMQSRGLDFVESVLLIMESHVEEIMANRRIYEGLGFEKIIRELLDVK